MEEEQVDDITEVSVLPTNLEMETETVIKIETSFHTNGIKIDGAVAPTDDCVAVSEDRNEFDSHMFQEEEFLFTKDGNYICDICGEIMTVRSSAERHMMQHFEKMVAEECEPTVSAPNDVIMTSSVVLPLEFVTNEPSSSTQLELNEMKIECNNESLMIESNDLHDASDSQFAESFSSGRQYKCDICGVILSKKNIIVEQHVGSHFETKPFECYLCTFSTNEKYNIIQHMLTHFGWNLGTRPFTCSVCPYSSNEKSRLTRHMLTHSGEKPFACDVCGFRFNRKDSLTKHMRVHVDKKMMISTGESEVESDSHSSRFTCGTMVSEIDQQPNSSATTSSVEEADSLMVAKLEPTDAAIADVEMSGSENEPSQELSLVNVSTKVFILSDKLDGISNEPVQLKTSDILSPDRDPLGNSDSEVTQTEDNFIQCDICTYRTAKKYRYKLREHMYLHTGERPFACELCDQKFSRKRNLDRHRLSHSGENPYGCKLCDYACKHKSLLTKHMKTHMKNGNSNGQDESNDTSHDSPIMFTVDSENVDLSESCSLGDDVNVGMSPNDIVTLQPSNDSPAVDPLQLRLNEEHSQDSGLSSSSGPKPVPASQKRFACEFCGYKSDKKFEFDVHMRTHTGEKPFACDLCDKRYIAKKTLNRHKKTHLLQKRCGLCDFTAMRESDLASHLKTHTQDGATVFLKEVQSESQYEPPDKPFQLELREEHLPDSGPSGSSCETPDSEELYVCDECGYKTNQKSILDSHLTTHNGEKLFVCEYCNKNYTVKKTLDRHIWECHGENLFNCGSCDYTAIRKSDLADHIKSHVKNEIAHVPSFAESSDKSYVKYIPPDDSKEMESNQMSNNSASGNTVGVNLPEDEHFSCVHCDFECDDITAWSEHMFKHTNEKSYSCDQCEYKTKFKASMDVHKMTHTEKKPASSFTVTCEFCDYPFTTKSDMNLHIMSRHSELYISCDVCDFKAFHKRSLELHKATHLKPYACQICDYKVDKESLLTRHIMTAHADVTQFACSSCDFKAGSITEVEQHILTTHSSPAAKTAPSTCATVQPPADKIDTLIPSQPDVKQYMCYACEFSASKVTQVEEHILNSHAVLMPDVSAPLLVSQLPENRLDAPSTSNAGEMYSCYACDFEASNITQVEQHILSTHNAPVSESIVSPMDVTTEASNSVLPL